MDVVISQMIKQKVLLIAANSASFLSNMFLVPERRRKEPSNTQSQGSQQVHNYGTLQFNKCFSGARVSSERRMAVQVDLAQAYFYLPLAEGHRHVLRLVYRRRLLQITCLPFGLSTAPKTFATVTNWVAQTLKTQGLLIIVYLDFLVAHQDIFAYFGIICTTFWMASE